MLNSKYELYILYPIRLSRGVDGGVHGELPSLYDPFSDAPCLRRTAFNKFNVELLNPCLKDWGEFIRFRFYVPNRVDIFSYKTNEYIPISMVRAFLSNRCFEIDRRVPALQQSEIDFPAIQISFEVLQQPVNDTNHFPLINLINGRSTAHWTAFEHILINSFIVQHLQLISINKRFCWRQTPTQKMRNNLPADIVPDLIANVQRSAAVRWAHNQRTFQTVNGQSKWCPCFPLRLHFSTIQQHSLSNSSPRDHFPVRITYLNATIGKMEYMQRILHFNLQLHRLYMLPMRLWVRRTNESVDSVGICEQTSAT